MSLSVNDFKVLLDVKELLEKTINKSQESKLSKIGNCTKCFFYKKDSGICRRLPPATHVFKTEKRNEKEFYPVAAFPPVNENMWCGEYKAEQ